PVDLQGQGGDGRRGIRQRGALDAALSRGAHDPLRPQRRNAAARLPPPHRARLARRGQSFEVARRPDDTVAVAFVAFVGFFAFDAALSAARATGVDLPVSSQVLTRVASARRVYLPT